MTLFAGVLKLSSWYSHDTLAVLACAGYIVVFAGIGIRWFQWTRAERNDHDPRRIRREDPHANIDAGARGSSPPPKLVAGVVAARHAAVFRLR